MHYTNTPSNHFQRSVAVFLTSETESHNAVKMATSMLKTNANVRLATQRRGQLRPVANRRMVVRAQAAATEDRIKIGINGESRKLCQSPISRAQSLIILS